MRADHKVAAPFRREDKVNVQPIKDRVLLERVIERRGMIQLTDADPIRKFKVIAVGPGIWREDENSRWFEPTTLKPGQVVILPGQAAEQPDKELGKDRIIVMENDIGAIVG